MAAFVEAREGATEVVDLAIQGMSCASCVGRVEKALARVPGVAGVAVNLATERARIQTRGGVRVEAHTQAVVAAGYEAAPAAQPGARAEPGGAALPEWWPVALAAALTAPLVVQMLGAFFGKDWSISPLTQLALATPVQFWLGARF